MKFMITFNHVDGEWDKLNPQEQQRHGTRLMDFISALESEKNSKLVFFKPVLEAKTIRMLADGSLSVNDGPYREISEQPGGYYVIEAESMDEAVQWAKRGRFMLGSNEVRQIVES